MISRKWVVMAFIETIWWTFALPYLIWQQWGWIPAVGVLAWWLFGYWRVTFKAYLDFRRFTRAMRPGYIAPDVQQAVDNYEDQEIHKWIDDGGPDLPEFSGN